MYPEERRYRIRRILYQERSKSVLEFAKILNVSDETIRRDIKALEKDKIIKKSYGMVSLSEENTNLYVPTIQIRKSKEQKEKILIAKEALKLLNNCQYILLDAGSTTEYIARELRNFNELKNINIITNGLNVAEECIKIDQVNVYLLGGHLRKNTWSIVGPQTTREVKNYNIDIAFLGATGILTEKGFFSSNIYEVEVKKSMVSVARKKVVVADHTKFGNYGLKSFCNFEDIDYIVTSDLVEASILRKIEKNYKEKLRIVKMNSSNKLSD